MRRRIAAATFLVLAVSSTAAQDFGAWRALGPFEHAGGSGNVDVAQSIERELAEMKAGGPGPDLAAEYKGKGNAGVRWRPLVGGAAESAELDVGLIEFAAALEPPPGVEAWAQNAVAYLYRRIESPDERKVAVQLGSDDGMRLWLNGALLVDKGFPRPLNLGDEALELELHAGVNHLLVKIAQGGGGWSFQMAPWKRIAQEPIDQAIDRGVAFLLANQLLDGSWGGHEGFGAGQTAYCVYTLLKCGIAPAHATVQRGLAFVRARPSGYTYSVSCELMALCALGDATDRSWIEERLGDLVELQESSGLYGYPVHPNGDVPPDDLSNTLYAALALRAGAQAGMKVPERTWRRLIDGSLRCFDPDADRMLKYEPDTAAAGFRYRPDSGTTGSMTTAGLGVLAIADEELDGQHSKAVRAQLDGARAAGLRWLARNMTWTMNPGQNDHHYFFVYGMERVGILLGLKVLGGVDWYWSGADYLVRNQRESGAWVKDDGYVDTILALLFLERATAPTTGKKSEPRIGRYATADPAAEVSLHASGDTPLAMWVGEIALELRKSLEWAGETGLGLHIEKVEFYARRVREGAELELLAVDAGDPARPAGARRFAAQHAFPASGEYALRARVHVVAPPVPDAAPAPLRVLESPELVVRIEGALAPAPLDYASDFQRNVLAGENPRVRASSTLGDGDRPELCADGLASTRWRSTADDAQPWIELALPRSTRVDRILLTHPFPRPRDRAGARPRTVELLVNGEERRVIEMDPDVLAKTVLVLEKPVRLRELRVTILGSSDRVVGTDPVGFAEIELQSAP